MSKNITKLYFSKYFDIQTNMICYFVFTIFIFTKIAYVFKLVLIFVSGYEIEILNLLFVFFFFYYFFLQGFAKGVERPKE